MGHSHLVRQPSVSKDLPTDNILRAGWYSPVHMKSRVSHNERALLASRKTVQSKCIDLENVSS
jgi:hypothetical protein